MFYDSTVDFLTFMSLMYLFYNQAANKKTAKHYNTNQRTINQPKENYLLKED